MSKFKIKPKKFTLSEVKSDSTKSKGDRFRVWAVYSECNEEGRWRNGSVPPWHGGGWEFESPPVHSPAQQGNSKF